MTEKIKLSAEDRKLKAKIIKMVNEVKNDVFNFALNSYTITLNFMWGECDDVKFSKKAMSVSTDWEYLQAEIKIYVPVIQEWLNSSKETEEYKDKALYTYIIHELLHVVLAELTYNNQEWQDKHEERVVTLLSNRICAIWKGESK